MGSNNDRLKSNEFAAKAWPIEMQQAVGKVILSASLAESVLGRFSKDLGRSGKDLVSDLEKYSETEIQALGVTYDSLLDDRNALVHGWCHMGREGVVRSTRFTKSSAWTEDRAFTLTDLGDLSDKFQALAYEAMVVEGLYPHYFDSLATRVLDRRLGTKRCDNENN